MSNESEANPYAAPAPSYVPVPKGAGSGRPGWYSFYCIMAIILGALGASSALMGLPGLFFGRYIQSVQPMQPTPAPNMPQSMQEMQDIQNEMNQELMAVGKRYFWFSLVEHVLLLVVGVALLVGGLMAMSMSRKGAAFLGTTFMFVSVFEVARSIITIFELMESTQIARKHLGPMIEKMPNRPPAFTSDCITNSVQAAFGGFLCFFLTWLVFKLWLYISGWMYFNKPQTQALLKD